MGGAEIDIVWTLLVDCDRDGPDLDGGGNDSRRGITVMGMPCGIWS